jgi:serine phosphatase RsbU (regulator of sigma subunit)/anti-sigma regulatory factor (Ser/Thr protein kinase)
LWLKDGLEGIRAVSMAGKNFLREQSVSEDDLIACELVLVEACNNAVLYSPDQGRNHAIETRIFCEAELIELHVIDHTRGFEWPEKIELPAEDEEHGRGLFLIQSMMDEVLYLRGNLENRLVMKKRRTPRATVAQAAAAPQPSSRAKGPEAPTLTSSRANVPREALKGRLESGSQKTEPSKLKAVEQKLAMSEQVIGAMAREISFRSEELAALLRSTSELGRTTKLENFSQRLLNDLLHISAADWFVLRLVPRNEARLVVTNASRVELELPPLPLNPDAMAAECRAANNREDILFHEGEQLAEGDPLAEAALNCSGIIRPIVVDDKLLGTLALGRKSDCSPLTTDQIQVVQTFADFLALHVENSRLQQEQVDSRIVAHELEIARNIQQSLLPVKFPRVPGFGLSGFCLSARQVGGDFYDVVSLAEDRVLMIVADVMGKGVPAALFAATMHTLVRTMTEWTDRPAEMLARMNRFLYHELSGVDMFITAQLVLVDAGREQLTLASAGHCPLLTCNEAAEITTHTCDGMPLGILPDLSFEERVISLKDCRCALLYTDGLTDARNSHGEFYGQERLTTWLHEHALKGQSAVQLSYAFLRDLKAFQAHVTSPDDQTFLVLAKEPDEQDAWSEHNLVMSAG